jgi:hypothetical protein
LPNPKQLPPKLAQDKSAQFRLYTGPKPTSGRVIVRVGLDDLPEVAEAKLSVRLNRTECKPIEDVAKPDSRKSYAHDPHRVFHVADLAQRIMQFEAPYDAMQRGYNQVDVRLAAGSDQKAIWMEIYIVP